MSPGRYPRPGTGGGTDDSGVDALWAGAPGQ